jgi:hypothetical protein
MPKRARCWSVAFCLALSGLTSAAAAQDSATGAQDMDGLRVESGSPDALCPDLALTREAVRRRVGALLVPSGSAWRLRYTIGHAPEGSPRDFVRLELFAPDGSRALERNLPLEGESCSTMADVIALVVDSHVSALRVQEPGARESTSSAPTAVVPAPQASAAHQPAAQPSAEPAPGAPSPSTLSPTAPITATTPPSERLMFLGAELGASSALGPALGGRALFELLPHAYLGLSASLPLLAETERLDDDVEVRARGLDLRAHFGWGPRWGKLRTYLGPGVRVTLQQGKAEGLPRDAAGVRALPALAIEAGAHWTLSPRASLVLSGALDRSLAKLGGQFNVDEREVLRPEAFSGWLGVGLGYGF